MDNSNYMHYIHYDAYINLIKDKLVSKLSTSKGFNGFRDINVHLERKGLGGDLKRARKTSKSKRVVVDATMEYIKYEDGSIEEYMQVQYYIYNDYLMIISVEKDNTFSLHFYYVWGILK